MLGFYNLPLNSKIYFNDLLSDFNCIELKNDTSFVEFDYPLNLQASPFSVISICDSKNIHVKDFTYKALSCYCLETLHKIQSHSSRKFSFQIINGCDKLNIWRGCLEKQIISNFIF